MSQWSEKIPKENLSESVSSTRSLFTSVRIQINNFRKSSKKFIIDFLTKNVALNLSGAIFFVGLGYSLKWWYKDHLFIVLLKQNLPALSEYQQNISWQTGESIYASLNDEYQTRAPLIDRVDLYANHIRVKFKQPRQKHAYERFIGVFGEAAQRNVCKQMNSSFNNNYLQDKLKKNTGLYNSPPATLLVSHYLSPPTTDSLRDSLLVAKRWDVSRFASMREKGTGVINKLNKFTDYTLYTPEKPIFPKKWFTLSPRNLCFLNQGVVSSRFAEKEKYKVAHSSCYASGAWGGDEAGGGQPNVEDPTCYAPNSISHVKRVRYRMSEVANWKPLRPGVSVLVAKRQTLRGMRERACLPPYEVQGLRSSAAGVSVLAERERACVAAGVVKQRGKESSADKFSYPLQLTKKLIGWQPSSNVLLLNSYLDEIPYKLENTLTIDDNKLYLQLLSKPQDFLDIFSNNVESNLAAYPEGGKQTLQRCASTDTPVAHVLTSEALEGVSKEGGKQALSRILVAKHQILQRFASMRGGVQRILALPLRGMRGGVQRSATTTSSVKQEASKTALLRAHIIAQLHGEEAQITAAKRKRQKKLFYRNLSCYASPYSNVKQEALGRPPFRVKDPSGYAKRERVPYAWGGSETGGGQRNVENPLLFPYPLGGKRKSKNLVVGRVSAYSTKESETYLRELHLFETKKLLESRLASLINSVPISFVEKSEAIVKKDKLGNDNENNLLETNDGRVTNNHHLMDLTKKVLAVAERRRATQKGFQRNLSISNKGVRSSHRFKETYPMQGWRVILPSDFGPRTPSDPSYSSEVSLTKGLDPLLLLNNLGFTFNNFSPLTNPPIYDKLGVVSSCYASPPLYRDPSTLSSYLPFPRIRVATRQTLQRFTSMRGGGKATITSTQNRAGSKACGASYSQRTLVSQQQNLQYFNFKNRNWVVSQQPTNGQFNLLLKKVVNGFKETYQINHQLSLWNDIQELIGLITNNHPMTTQSAHLMSFFLKGKTGLSYLYPSHALLLAEQYKSTQVAERRTQKVRDNVKEETSKTPLNSTESETAGVSVLAVAKRWDVPRSASMRGRDIGVSVPRTKFRGTGVLSFIDNSSITVAEAVEIKTLIDLIKANGFINKTTPFNEALTKLVKKFTAISNANKISFKQSGGKLETLDELDKYKINVADTHINFEKDLRYMSGYVYPDIQSNSLKAHLYEWLGKNKNLMLFNNQMMGFKETYHILDKACLSGRNISRKGSTPIIFGLLYPPPASLPPHAPLDGFAYPRTKFRGMQLGSSYSEGFQRNLPVQLRYSAPDFVGLPRSNGVSDSQVKPLIRFEPLQGKETQLLQGMQSIAEEPYSKPLWEESYANITGPRRWSGGGELLPYTPYSSVKQEALGRPPFRVKDPSSLHTYAKRERACLPPSGYAAYAWGGTVIEDPSESNNIKFPYRKFNHYLAKFPGFSDPSQFFTTLPEISCGNENVVNKSQEKKEGGEQQRLATNPVPLNFVRGTETPVSLRDTETPAAYVLTPEGVSKEGGKQALQRIGEGPTPCTPYGRGEWRGPERQNSDAALGILAERGGGKATTSTETPLESVNLVDESEINKVFIQKNGSNPRKVAYSGIVVQRNKGTKDFQPFKEAKKPLDGAIKSSIWGTLFLGPENPLTDRQCHFFGQKQLSTLDANSLQRDYLRQLGKEIVTQSNSKGYTELSKFSSIERTKILSLSKKVNSFFFKKRKYSYLLEEGDQWHLLFQEQLCTALEDCKKYPLSTIRSFEETNIEKLNPLAGRIKVSAPLIMARFPKKLIQPRSMKQETTAADSLGRLKQEAAAADFGESCPPAYSATQALSRFAYVWSEEASFTRNGGRPNAYVWSEEGPTLRYAYLPLSSMRSKDSSKLLLVNTLGKVDTKLANHQLEQGISWRPFCYLQRSSILEHSSSNGLPPQRQKLVIVYGPNYDGPQLLSHYPPFTERSSEEWSASFNNNKNSSFSSLLNGRPATQYWAVLNQWVFLIALLFWVEQTLINNVFPALFALEQSLLSAAGIKNNRTHVFRISKNETPKFQNLAGIDGLLGELSELVLFLRGQRNLGVATFGFLKKWNKKNSYGVLLTGSPGTGKTFLVRALANEAKVPVLILSASALTTSKVNNNKPSWSIRHAFKRAKQLAPCILFIDEIDALGKSRGQIVTDINEIVAERDVDSLNAAPLPSSLRQGPGGVGLAQHAQQMFSYEQFGQNCSNFSTTLLNKWEYPLHSTILQESNEINGSSLCQEKLVDLLKIAPTSSSAKKLATQDSSEGTNETPRSTRGVQRIPAERGRGNANSPNLGTSGELPTREKEMTRGKFGPLTQLLVSMDGVSSFSGVLIMGATNRPELLDPALTRPGRFEKIIRIDKPSEQNRIEILQLYSQNLGVQQQIPWSYLATRTIGLTTADLAVAMNYSSLRAIIQGSVHTLETIEYGLNCITRL